MTIEYKDSKRIVKLSTDNLGLSFEDDFNTNDWDDAGTRFGVNTTTEKI